VVVLTDGNFDDLVGQGEGAGGWLIEIYAPWCGACKELFPIWSKAATKLASLGVRVGAIDGTTNAELQARFQPTHYPTLLYVRDGRLYRYEQARALKALRAFVKGGYESTVSVDLPRPGETLPQKEVLETLRDLIYAYPVFSAIYIAVMGGTSIGLIYLVWDSCRTTPAPASSSATASATASTAANASAADKAEASRSQSRSGNPEDDGDSDSDADQGPPIELPAASKKSQ
jgi:thiol-disulfide isomerase/thioredoxin